MRLLIAALILAPSMAFAHDRILHGIVVPNGYNPAWEDGRVNRNTGDMGVQAYVEAGRFHSLAAAQAAASGFSNAQVMQVGHSAQFRLWLGPYPNRDAAQDGLNAAHAAGLGHGRVR